MGEEAPLSYIAYVGALVSRSGELMSWLDARGHLPSAAGDARPAWPPFIAAPARPLIIG